MAEVTTEPVQEQKTSGLNADSKGLGTVGKILSTGIENPVAEEKGQVAKTLVDNLTRDLVKEGAEEVKPEVVAVVEEIASTQASAVADIPNTEVVAEVKTETDWFNETAPITVEKQEEIKATNTKDLEIKAKKYDEILDDKLTAAWFSAKNVGKDITTFLAEVSGIDPNKLSLEQLMEIQLKSENLSPEAFTEEMDRFKDLGERAQKIETKEVKARLISEQENKLKEYSANNQASQAKMLEIGHRALKEKEQYLESKKGKKEMGIEMTPTLISELNTAYENFNIEREDRSIDVPRIMNLLLLEKKSKLIAQTAYSKGRTDMELEFYKTHSRPSKDNGITVVPEVKIQNKQSQDETNMNALERKFSHRGQGSRVN